MAIQLRRGSYDDMNPDLLVPGELVAVLEDDINTDDGKALYACFETGEVKRVLLADDVETEQLLVQTQTIVNIIGIIKVKIITISGQSVSLKLYDENGSLQNTVAISPGDEIDVKDYSGMSIIGTNLMSVSFELTRRAFYTQREVDQLLDELRGELSND